MFFDMNETLCQRYQALTPFIVRRERFGEVILLVKRINEKSYREKGGRKGDVVTYDKKGNKHIRREAKNDNWY